MDSMETLVRETLAARADDAPGAGGLLDAVRAAETSAGRHRWWYAGLAAAVVAGIAVSVVVLTRGGGGAGQAAAHHARPTTSTALPCPTCPAPSTTPISYHGITVDVPAGMKVTQGGCSLPSAYVLTLDAGAQYSCGAMTHRPKPPSGPVIALTPSDATDRAVRRLATQQVIVDGVPARRGSGRVARLPGVTRVLYLPHPGVVVAVSAKRGAAVGFVIPSVRITPIDRFGCRARTDAGPPPGNAVADRLVPGRPTSAIVCEYASTYGFGNTPQWLVTSARLPDIDRVASRINRLPLRPVKHGLLIPAHDWVVFHYADGTTRTIAVERNATPARVTDGHLVARDNSLSIQSLIEHVR